MTKKQKGREKRKKQKEREKNERPTHKWVDEQIGIMVGRQTC
jgi:hypothetical protein